MLQSDVAELTKAAEETQVAEEPTSYPFSVVDVPDLTTVGEMAHPADATSAPDGETLLVVGSIEDPDLNRRVPTVWEGTDPVNIEPTRLAGVNDHSTILSEAIPFAGGWVAVGYAALGHDEYPVAYIRGPDGAWSPNALGDLESPESGLSAVVNVDERLVARGWIEVDSQNQPALWHSVDGISWVEADTPPPPTNGQVDTVRDVATNGSVTIAVGRHRDARGELSTPLIWMSDDGGQAWNEVETPDLLTADTSISLTSIVWDDTRFLIGATVEDTEGFASPALYETVDGELWRETPTTFEQQATGWRATFGYGVTELRVLDDGSYLARSDSGVETYVWTSEDGSSWVVAGNIQLANEQVVAIGDVESHDGALLAIGSSQVIAQVPGGRWTRVISPERLPEPDNTYVVSSIAANADRIVIAGSKITPGPTTLSRPFVWHSADGGSWEGLEFDRTATSTNPTIEADESGFVGVGTVEGVASRNAGIYIFSSPDGVEWSREQYLFERPTVRNEYYYANDILKVDGSYIVAGWYKDFDQGSIERPLIIRGEERDIDDEGVAGWHNGICERDDVVVVVGQERPGTGSGRDLRVAGTLFDLNGAADDGNGEAGDTAERSEVLDTDGSFAASPTTVVVDCLGLADGTWIAWGRVANNDDTSDVMVWRSDDGLNWTAVDVPFVGPGSQYGVSMVESPEGIILLGRDFEASDADLIWLLRDEIWHVVPDPIESDLIVRFRDIAVIDDTVLVIGTERNQQRVWQAPLDELVERAVPVSE